MTHEELEALADMITEKTFEKLVDRHGPVKNWSRQLRDNLTEAARNAPPRVQITAESRQAAREMIESLRIKEKATAAKKAAATAPKTPKKRG